MTGGRPGGARAARENAADGAAENTDAAKAAETALPAREAPAPGVLALGLPSGYEIEHLARVFFPGAAVRAGRCTKGPLVYARAGRRRLAAGLRTQGGCTVVTAPLPMRAQGAPPAGFGGGADFSGEVKRALARLLYTLLRRATGVRPPWGMLTGVRPVNLLRKAMQSGGEKAARERLLFYADVSPEKFEMAMRVYQNQRPVLDGLAKNSYSLYVSVPFCPSRCSYCSFVSRTIGREGHLVEPYLEKLERELALTAGLAAGLGLSLTSVYIGGGTPTALDLPALERLLRAVERYFAPAGVAEYTVEAGRPDCTGYHKLALLKSFGVGRISINPQTMDDAVLAAIGRRHTAADVERCFADARRAGHGCVNMDLIAGLPGDTAAGFGASLGRVLALGPENVTVHTLTLKRASSMVTDGRADASPPRRMIEAAGPALDAAGYAPYYLYRQKSGVQNLENTGWTRPGYAGVYNVCIMEEAQTVLAVGAGASTKVVAGGGAVIKRFYNPKLPLEYIRRFELVTERKEGVKHLYAGYLDTQAPG